MSALGKKNEDGTLKLIQVLSLVDGEKTDDSKAAEIAISKDGRHLYATNRGVLNTVTVFSVTDGSSRAPLTQIQQVAAPSFPRGMELAQGGRVLLVASQEDTTLQSFTVASDGTLTPGKVIETGLPNHPATLVQFSLGQSVTV